VAATKRLTKAKQSTETPRVERPERDHPRGLGRQSALSIVPTAVQCGDMVRPSRDRLNQLGRDLVDALARTRAVVLLKDREAVQLAVSQALADELRREEEREASARKRINALRHPPRPNTSEWEELFRKFVEEEYLREGLDS
jgi:hypothetical protein